MVEKELPKDRKAEKDSSRRRFIKKIATLGVASGVATLLLGRLSGKELVPPVHGADLVIDAVNTGTGKTELRSSGSDVTLMGYASATTGYTYGIRGQADSTSGTGVEGVATAHSGNTCGVHGGSDSPLGAGVQGFGTCGVRGMSWSTSGTGVLGTVYATGGIGILGGPGNAAAVPIVARGASTQTANLQEWQKSDGTALTRIDKDGKLGIGTAPEYMLHIVSGVTGPLTAASAPGAGPVPNSFICENLTPGNFKSQFTFRHQGANKWSFGNDVSGNGGQDFFIYDEVAAATRLSIDSAGNVKVKNLVTGDVSFANGYKLTEDNESGISLLNQKGKRIAKFDEEGNIHIKGDVIKDL